MRVLLAIHNAYTDSTSGAARSNRTMLEWLAAGGHDCCVLSTARFEGYRPESLREHLDEFGCGWECRDSEAGPCVEYSYRLQGVDVVALDTEHHQIEQPNSAESAQFVAMVKAQLQDLRPDILVAYGGHPVVQQAMRMAREVDVPTLFSIHNYGYEDTRLFRFADHVKVSSRFLHGWYRDQIGIHSTVIAPAMDWSKIRAVENTREFVTFVNPSAHKGAALVGQLSCVLAERRPEIPVLVVESRSARGFLALFPNRVVPQTSRIMLGPPTDDPREFYSLTRILLIPSVFAEPFGRVAAEAMINGIPPLVSASGALPETVCGVGNVLSAPRLTTDGIQSAELVEEWFAAITRLWDSPELYARESDRARAIAEEHYSERVLRDRYQSYFQACRR